MPDWLTLVPSAARTVNGSAGLDLDDTVDQVRLVLDVTAVAGTTPSMVVVIEESHDGVNYNPTAVDTFPAVTAAGRTYRTIPTGTLFGQFFRARWTITGTTPSFTFSIFGAQKLVR